MSNGKGSKPRPLSVSYEKYSDNFDAIFRKKHTVEVKELPNGDKFIEVPEKVLNKLGWKEGDDIGCVDTGEGYKLKKKKEK